MTNYYKKYLKYKQKYLQTKTNSLTGGMNATAPTTTSTVHLFESDAREKMLNLGSLLNYNSFLIDSIHDDLLIPGTTGFPFMYDEDKIIRNTVNNNTDLIGLVVSDAEVNENDYIKSANYETDKNDFNKNIERMQEILNNSVVFIDAGAGGFKSMYNDDKQPWKPRDERNWICGDNKKDIYNVLSSNLNTNTFSNIFDSASIGKGCPVCIKTLANILEWSQEAVINQFYQLVLTFLEGHSTGDYTLQDWIPAIQFLKQIKFTISDCKIKAAFNDTSSPFIISQAMCAQKINELGEQTIPRKEPKNTNTKFINDLQIFLKKQGKSDKIQIMVYRILKYMGDKSHFVWAVYLVLIDDYLKRSGWTILPQMPENPNFDIYTKGTNTIQWFKQESNIILMTVDRLLFSDIVKIMNKLSQEVGIYHTIYYKICVFISQLNGKIPVSCENLALYTSVSKVIPSLNLKCITVYKGDTPKNQFVLFLYSIYSELESALNEGYTSIDEKIESKLIELLNYINNIKASSTTEHIDIEYVRTQYSYIYTECKIINQKKYSDNKFNEIILYQQEINKNLFILNPMTGTATLNHYSKNLVTEAKEYINKEGQENQFGRSSRSQTSSPIPPQLKSSPILLGIYDPRDPNSKLCSDINISAGSCAQHNYDLEIYNRHIDKLTYIYKCLTKFELSDEQLHFLYERTLIFNFCKEYIDFFKAVGIEIVGLMMGGHSRTQPYEPWKLKGQDLPSKILQQEIYYALKSINDICEKIANLYTTRGGKIQKLAETRHKFQNANQNIISKELLEIIDNAELEESNKIYTEKLDFFNTQFLSHQGGSTVNKKVSNKIIKNLYGGTLATLRQNVLNEYTRDKISVIPENFDSILSSCIRIINTLDLHNKIDINLDQYINQLVNTNNSILDKSQVLGLDYLNIYLQSLGAWGEHDDTIINIMVDYTLEESSIELIFREISGKYIDKLRAYDIKTSPIYKYFQHNFDTITAKLNSLGSFEDYFKIIYQKVKEFESDHSGLNISTSRDILEYLCISIIVDSIINNFEISDKTIVYKEFVQYFNNNPIEEFENTLTDYYIEQLKEFYIGLLENEHTNYFEVIITSINENKIPNYSDFTRTESYKKFYNKFIRLQFGVKFMSFILFMSNEEKINFDTTLYYIEQIKYIYSVRSEIDNKIVNIYNHIFGVPGRGINTSEEIVQKLLILTHNKFNINEFNKDLSNLVFIKFNSFISDTEIVRKVIKNLDNIIETYSIQINNLKDAMHKLTLNIYICIYIFYTLYESLQKSPDFVNFSNKLTTFNNTLDINNNEKMRILGNNKLLYLLYSVYYYLINSTFKKLVDLANKFDKVYMQEFFT